jgi:hypothetical protein
MIKLTSSDCLHLLPLVHHLITNRSIDLSLPSLDDWQQHQLPRPIRDIWGMRYYQQHQVRLSTVLEPVPDLRRSSSRFPRPYGAVACTPTELSYEILTSEPYQTSSGWYSSRSSVLVDTHTTGALILNPIACGLAGLVMILAPIAALVSGRVVHGVSLVR